VAFAFWVRASPPRDWTRRLTAVSRSWGSYWRVLGEERDGRRRGESPETAYNNYWGIMLERFQVFSMPTGGSV
jgi:hypothetical protein